jgi:alpha-1,3-rhamnosyl/mannosyltransferase
VASNATALPEVVGDAGVLVPPRDVTAWTGALGDLVDDEPARAELAERGRRRATQFTWAATAQAHLRAYAAARSDAARS